MRKAPLVLALLLASAACTPPTADAPDTTAAAGRLAGDGRSVCETVEALPLPLRRGAMEAAGDAADVLEEMRDQCPATLADLVALEDVVAASSALDDAVLLADHSSEISCGESGISMVFTNPFESDVRLVVTGAFVDGTGATLVAGATVTSPIQPEADRRVFLELEPPPNAAGCRLETQPFLHVEDGRATDTWNDAARIAPGPVLPDTTGDDWAAILTSIIEHELAVATAGDWAASGGFEDVRSKNYAALTAQVEPQTGTGRVPAVCRVDAIDDRVTLVVYEYSNDLIDRALAAGAFRRSPVDGRWRWLMTSMILDADGQGCDALEEGLVA